DALHVERLADRAEHDLGAERSVREEVDVRKRVLRPRVDAQMGRREHEHPRHGAVRKDAELLPEHGGAAGLGAGVEDLAHAVGVGQDRGTAHPRVEGVKAHRSVVLEYGHGLLRADGVEAPPEAWSASREVLGSKVQATPWEAARVTVTCEPPPSRR